MQEFIEYRNLGNNKKRDKFISILEQFGIDHFLEIVKLTGITINQYHGKNRYYNLITSLNTELINRLPENEYAKWTKLLNQSHVINECYSDFFSDENYIKTLDIKEEEEISAFIIILEKYLYFINNIIQDNEIENKRLNINFDVSFSYEIPYSKEQLYGKMFDRCSNIANDVIKYLMFYKNKNSVILSEVDNLSLHNAFFHLTNIDKKEVLNSIVADWQFGGRDIINESSGTVISKVADNSLIQDEFIALNRIEHRRQTIINDMVFARSLENKKNCNLQEEDDEFTKEYLKEVLYGYSEEYCCLISGDNVKLGYLVRAYGVLKRLALKFISMRKDINSNILNDICFIISEKKLEQKLSDCNIPKEEVDRLLSIFTYNKKGDLFDTPLIKNGSNFIIIPSIVAKADISQVILSIVDQFNFRGKLFENAVLELLHNNSISAYSEKYQDESGEYQCDIIFLIDKDLFICECKAWGESRTARGFYNQLSKCHEAKKQLDRIATKYIEKKDWLKKEFDFNGEFRNITKIIITSNAIGRSNQIGDTYFIDFSALSRFIKRDKPSIELRHKNMRYVYELPKYSEFRGKLTYNKMIRFLNNPAPVDLALKNTKKSIRTMPINKIKFEYEVYENQLSYFADLSEDADTYFRALEKTYGLK